ncbi:MAG: flagellar biosynthetic protein FliR [Alphaproteobacteria bacterium]|nr:flagellar biosynthetic protein FliR [Alphaproteobacteria bacterium]
MLDLQTLLSAQLFPLLLVFARLGSAFAMLPGIGEVVIAGRSRLLLALSVSLVVAPVVSSSLPPLPASPADLLALVGGEIVVGLFLGTTARLMLIVLEEAGSIISIQTGLSSAQVFNPGLANQSALTGAILMTLGVVVIMATNLHLVAITAIIDSYTLFRPGQPLMWEDLAHVVVKLVSHGFLIAVQIAAPYFVLGILFFTALGVMARLMPQVQVFFIALPVQVMGGLLIFALTLSAGMMWWLSFYEAGLRIYLAPR